MNDTLKRMLGIYPSVELGEIINQGATILDVRTKEEFSQGHIKGAINISLDKLPQNLSKLKGKDKAIIACCASGMRSGSAKSFLSSNGFTNVHNGGSWFNLKRKYNL
ncbi:MAG: rhodanese-like domain-containing protein [Bacteroidales bacterium]|jgi:rhodanese-related sulfurtransferase|nr:rhodanese-like domain-containing protein [Bacteroidales bacterium]